MAPPIISKIIMKERDINKATDMNKVTRNSKRILKEIDMKKTRNPNTILKVVDMNNSTRIEVGLILASSDFDSNSCFIHRILSSPRGG